MNNDQQQPKRNAWWVISNTLGVVVLGYWAIVLGGIVSDFRDISIANHVWQETAAFAQLPKVTQREVLAFAGRRFRERGLDSKLSTLSLESQPRKEYGQFPFPTAE